MIFCRDAVDRVCSEGGRSVETVELGHSIKERSGIGMFPNLGMGPTLGAVYGDLSVCLSLSGRKSVHIGFS